MHAMEAGILRFIPEPTDAHLARLRAQPTKAHPLVWTHRSGRKSLVIGSCADVVLDMPLDQGRTPFDTANPRTMLPTTVLGQEDTR